MNLNFKNKQEYLDQRVELMNNADKFMKENKLDEADKIINQVETLDNQWKEDAVNLANEAALQNKFKSLKIENGGINNMEKVLENENVFASNEYKNAWLKNLQGKELNSEEIKLVNAVNGTAVIPTQTLNKIIEKLEQTSALYSKITTLNIPSNISIPVENAKNDASWVAMATASTDSDDSFSTVSLAAYKLIKTIEITADVENMSIQAFEGFIVNSLYKKMAKAIENAILNGTGTNQPTGLLKSGEITTTTTFTKAGMTYKDLMKIIGQLGTSYLPGACFVMPRAVFFNDVLGMSTSTGDRVVVADAQSPAKYNILGYPVILADYCTADTIIFGDLSYYYFNWVKDVEVKSDGSVGFRSGSTVYRAMALCDGKKVLGDAFCTATRALS